MSLDVNSNEQAEDLVKYAFEHGVNYFDTADLYDRGENEKVLGKAIKSFRKEIILATKVGNRWSEDSSGWRWDVSTAYIQSALEDSLSRLQTDYIDLYQIHGGTIEDDFDVVVETLELLVRQGKIRCYGISSIRPNVFTKYCKASNIVSNMMQYSILDNRAEKYFDGFEESNVAVIARGTLAQGLLINKEAKPYLNLNKEEVFDVQQKINNYCRENGLSQTAFALKYVLDKPIVASALVGVRTKKQFDDILSSFDSLQELNIDFERFDFPSNTYLDHLS